MTKIDRARELFTYFGSAQKAIYYTLGMIEENESVLEMLKRHGNERARVPVLARIDYLNGVVKELRNLS